MYADILDKKITKQKRTEVDVAAILSHNSAVERATEVIRREVLQHETKKTSHLLLGPASRDMTPLSCTL